MTTVLRLVGLCAVMMAQTAHAWNYGYDYYYSYGYNSYGYGYNNYNN